MTLQVALVGNPNCGKTTLFNTLTRGAQRTGNWSGVTVEKKTGTTLDDQTSFEIVDLPGLYNLNNSQHNKKLDEALTRNFLIHQHVDVIVNVVDATTLARGLFLTTQLRELNIPVVVVLTMFDVAKKHEIQLDCSELSTQLDCSVVPVNAAHKHSRNLVLQSVRLSSNRKSESKFAIDDRFKFVDRLVDQVVQKSNTSKDVSRRIDRWVLNRYLAIPLFLIVMYAMFFFSINVGSVLIDFFDIIGGLLFVDTPRILLQAIGSPSWLTAFVADGVGSGVQLVGTFLPVIGALFLFLSILEDSGYMARVAFILDKPLRALGLPGKALVPLIVGFGCNVPSVMSTRSLDNQPDRILTTIMAPFMSCGARLTVYVLFVAAFFPSHGQNIVFLLYLIGILIALATTWIVRTQLLTQTASSFAQELPKYHFPNWRNLIKHTWYRLRDFVLRAGRAIVMVVIVLQLISSIGTDGSFGNEESDNSVLSAIGRTITPVFAPMGINEENWAATVGIFTGFFAKEVVVGTLDALYTPRVQPNAPVDFGNTLASALISVPQNLVALKETLLDPLGLQIDQAESIGVRAAQNNVELNTVIAIQNLFDGRLGAFSYLVFLLLYVPCVATIGVILRELGGFWATFSVVWSITVAYALAVCVYQLGQLGSNPINAISWILGMVTLSGICMWLLTRWGRRTEQKANRLLEVVHLE